MAWKPTKRWGAAYSALYGSGEAPPQPAARKKPVQHERNEQIKFVVWCQLHNILHYAIPNGGHRNPIEAANLKRSGTIAGVPDMCLPLPRSSHHGLYIEFKWGSNKLTDEQSWWVAQLKQQGYAVFVAYSADEAIEYTRNYLGV